MKIENTLHNSAGCTCRPGCAGGPLGVLRHAPAPATAAPPYRCPLCALVVNPARHVCWARDQGVPESVGATVAELDALLDRYTYRRGSDLNPVP